MTLGLGQAASAGWCNCENGLCKGSLKLPGELCKYFSAEGPRGNDMSKKPLDEQVGGNHYKDMAIQPIDYIMKNGIGYCEGNVIKYVTRWKFKNGVEDLKKARHYIDILIGEQDG